MARPVASLTRRIRDFGEEFGELLGGEVFEHSEELLGVGTAWGRFAVARGVAAVAEQIGDLAGLGVVDAAFRSVVTRRHRKGAVSERPGDGIGGRTTFQRQRGMKLSLIHI